MELAECATCRAPLLARDAPCPYCGALPPGVALVGPPASFEPLPQGAGAFVPPPVTPGTGANTLDLPAWGNSTESRPAPPAMSMHAIPQKIPGVDVARLNLTPFEGYLLMLVDGATPAEDLVAASGLGAADAAAAFGRLAQLGALAFKAAPETEARGGTGETAVARVALKKVTASGAPVLDVATLLGRVRQARSVGDLAGARQHLRTAREEYPDDAEVMHLADELTGPHHAKHRAGELVHLGVGAERVGSMAMAVTFYERALAEFEPSAVLHHRVALCMLHAGLPQQQALDHARRASELAPQDGRFTQLYVHLQNWRS